jgi:hypothetical protein
MELVYTQTRMKSKEKENGSQEKECNGFDN